MKKSDFVQWLLQLTSQLITQNRDHFHRLSDQSDRIVVWLVGFSLGGIALCLGNQTELNSLLPSLSRNVMLFGSLTAIFGVLHRVFLFLAQNLESQMLISFQGFIEGYTNPPTVFIGRDIEPEYTYEEIVDLIKSDFDIEVEKIDTSILSAEQVDVLRESVVDYYNSLMNWSENILSEGIEDVKDVFRSYLGFTKDRADQIFDPKPSKVGLGQVFNFCKNLSTLLFLLSCTTFIIGIVSVFAVYVLHYGI